MKRTTIAFAIGSGCALAWLAVGSRSDVAAQTPPPDPNTCSPAECGQVSPLIPMQSVEAVHMGLVWKKNSDKPKILFHARFPEYAPNDMADPELVDLAIERGAFTTPGLQFNSSLRDVLHGFDPFLGLGTNRSPDDSFLTTGDRYVKLAFQRKGGRDDDDSDDDRHDGHGRSGHGDDDNRGSMSCR